MEEGSLGEEGFTSGIANEGEGGAGTANKQARAV